MSMSKAIILILRQMTGMESAYRIRQRLKREKDVEEARRRVEACMKAGCIPVPPV